MDLQFARLVVVTTTLVCHAVTVEFAHASATETPNISPRMQDLVGKLATGSAGGRRDAAIALGRMGTPDASAIAALASALEDEILDVRSAAAFALGRIGSAASVAVVNLIEALGDTDASVRSNAAYALGEIGIDAAPAAAELTRLLSDDRDEVRRNAAFALGRTGLADNSILDALAAALLDPSIPVRTGAAEAIGILGRTTPAVQQSLLGALRDENVAVRRSVTRALSRLQVDDEAVFHLTEALQDADDMVRIRAVEALGAQGARSAVSLPKLVEMVTSPVSGIRRAVTTSLGRIGPAAPITIEALSRVAKDPDPEVRTRAIGALGIADSPRSVSLLIGALSDSSKEVRKTAIESLSNSKDLAKEAVPHLLSALGDLDEEIRARAAFALGNSNSSKVVPALVKSLQDGSALVRKYAIEACAQLGDNALDALPALVQTSRDPDVEVRSTLAASLSNFTSPSIITPLEEMLQDRDESVRAAAIDSLSSLDANIFGHLSALVSAISNPDPYVRKKAATAMGLSQAASAVTHLEKALDDSDLGVRLAAIDAIASVGMSAPQAVDGLTRALQSKDVEIRRAAASALGSIGSAKAIPALVEALGDADLVVVQNSLSSLSIFQEIPLELGRLIIGQLKNVDPSIRPSASYLSYQLGPAAKELAPIVIDWLEDRTTPEKDSIAYGYLMLRSQVGPDRGVTVSRAKFALKALLGDPDENVRAAVISTVAELAFQGDWERADIWPLIIALLDDASANVRATAVSLLGRAQEGQEAELVIGPLVRALADRNSIVRQTAIGALEVLGRNALPAVPDLIVALREPDAWVRVTAASALGAIGSEEAVPALASALEDGSVYVRESAARALTAIGLAASNAVPALSRALQDRQLQVRSAAADALAAIGPSAIQALPSLVSALQDNRQEVRLSAVSAIGSIGSPNVLPSLVPLLQDPNTEVELATIEVFRTIGSAENVVELAPLLESKEEKIRIAVATALGEFKSSKAVPALNAALKDSSAPVRAAAAASLASIGSKYAVKALVASLRDGDTGVRTQAVDALGKIQSHEPTAIAGLIGSLQDPKPEVRLTAVRALSKVVSLGELGKQKAVRDLLELMSDDSPDVRRVTAESVAELAQNALVTNDLDAIDPIFSTVQAMKTTGDQETRQYVDAIETAGKVLRDRRWSVRLNKVKTWAGNNWEIASVIVVASIWFPFWFVFYLLYPLHFLSIALAWRSITVPLPGRLENIKVSLQPLILGGLWKHPRVLDAWVLRHVGNARQAFETKRTVSDRSIHITMPVELDRETLAALRGTHLRDVFDQNPGCLLIWGEGGTGKTSIACQIGHWAMSNDPTERPSTHLMLPILIERELDFVPAERSNVFTEAVRGDLQRLVNVPVPVEFVHALLRQRRLLVIIDHLSELSERTRDQVRPDVPDFPASALIVTSRLEERLGDVSRSVLKPLKVTGDYLFEFLSSYLRYRGVRDHFPDQEFALAAGRIAELVGDRATTVLLVKLYADQLILSKKGESDEVMPDNIPDLMLCYLNNINASVPEGERRDPKLVHRDAQAVAWCCLRKMFRPGQADTEHEIVPALQEVGRDTVTDAAETLRYLERRLSLVETLDPGYRARFILDPLTEYLAGLHLVNTFGDNERSWRQFIIDAQAKTTEEGTVSGFLLAIRDCCLNRDLSDRVAELVIPELDRLAARDRTQRAAA